MENSSSIGSVHVSSNIHLTMNINHCNFLIKPSRYKDIIPGMGGRIAKMMERWSFLSKEKEQNPIEICREFSILTLDNIGIAIFGEDFGSTSIFEEVSILLKKMQERAQQLYPVHKYIPKCLWDQKFKKANERIHEIVREKIRNRTQRTEKENLNGKKFLLDVFLDAKEKV
jgi:hypothetical protein